jgi:hypothetical protein
MSILVELSPLNAEGPTIVPDSMGSGLMGEAAFAGTIAAQTDGTPVSGGITANDAKLIGEAGAKLVSVIGGVITGNTGKLTPEQLAALQREAERQRRARDRARTMGFVVVAVALGAFLYLRRRK